jgi:hypothetical protein
MLVLSSFRTRALSIARLPVLLVIGLLALVPSLACKRKPVCHGNLGDDPEKDDLVRMYKSIQDGVEPCPQHLRPKVVVSATGVVLDGRTIVASSALPIGTLKKVEALFTELKAYRELWKMTHPALAFEAQLTAVIDPDIDGSAGASILQTAAFAGFPRMRVESGGVTFETYWSVPRPPRPGDEETESLYLRRTTQGWYELRFVGPPKKNRPADASARDVAALLEELATTCASRSGACADVLAVGVDHPTFLELAQLVRAILGSPAFSRRSPELKFVAPAG